MKELRGNLEIAKKDVSHKDVRDYVVAYIEMRHGPSANGRVPMDIGHQEEYWIRIRCA